MCSPGWSAGRLRGGELATLSCGWAENPDYDDTFLKTVLLNPLATAEGSTRIFKSNGEPVPRKYFYRACQSHRMMAVTAGDVLE